MTNHEHRAFYAYLRSGGIDHPTYADTVEAKGKSYVVLHTQSGRKGETLAVYRIRPNGILKRLARPPKGLIKRVSHAVADR